MSNLEILEKGGNFRGKNPEEIIGDLYHSFLEPQMQAKNMKHRLDVSLSELVFCGGIDPAMKETLENSPEFQGTEFHVADNLETRRINFFSTSLPVALAGCDMVRTTLREGYRKWCEEISRMPKGMREAETRKYHCLPGSFDWPDPCETLEEVENELKLFAKAMAVSQMVPVFDTDVSNMKAVSKAPAKKSYGVFQVGKSQFWLMPYFEPNTEAKISGKPVRLGPNVFDAYLKFREDPKQKDHALRWVQWFEENCYGMYRTGDVEVLQKQFVKDFMELKGKTAVPKQRDLYDRIVQVVTSDDSWDLG